MKSEIIYVLLFILFIPCLMAVEWSVSPGDLAEGCDPIIITIPGSISQDATEISFTVNIRNRPIPYGTASDCVNSGTDFIDVEIESMEVTPDSSQFTMNDPRSSDIVQDSDEDFVVAVRISEDTTGEYNLTFTIVGGGFEDRELILSGVNLQGCVNDSNCSGSTPFCKTSTGECVECIVDNDCNDDKVCSIDDCVSNVCNYTNNDDLTRNCNASNGCSGSQRCVDNSWGSCITDLTLCDIDCDGEPDECKILCDKCECEGVDDCLQVECKMVDCEDSECVYTDINECNDDDSCCPSSCTSDNDNDCKKGCSSDEDCDDNDDCTLDICLSSTEECFSTTIDTCTNDDGCCPSRCTIDNDNDCCVSDWDCTSGECVNGTIIERCVDKNNCKDEKITTKECGDMGKVDKSEIKQKDESKGGLLRFIGIPIIIIILLLLIKKAFKIKISFVKDHRQPKETTREEKEETETTKDEKEDNNPQGENMGIGKTE